MSRRRHRLASVDDFWKRIVARYGCRTVLSRPRVPLVFFQRRVAHPARLSNGKAPSYVVSYRLALHVHLAWPAWLGSARASHSHEAAPRQSRHLAMARLPFAGVPRLAYGSASRGSNVVASASIPARGHGAPPLAPDRRGDIARVATTEPPRTHVTRQGLRPKGMETAPPQPPPDVATFTDVSRTVALRDQAFGLVAPRWAAGVLGLLGRRSGVSTDRLGSPSSATLRWHTPLARFDQRAVMAPRDLTRRVGRPDDGGPSWMRGVRSQLYGEAVPRSFANQPRTHSADPVLAREHRPDVPASRPRESAPQPPIDLGKLSEEVYRHIQRKIRIERERRGL
jgi:hypothetical protein